MKDFLMILAATVLVALTGCATNKTKSSPPMREEATIVYNFPAMPVRQILDEYQKLTKLTIMNQLPSQCEMSTINIQTKPLTPTEARLLLEKELKAQAGVVIKHHAAGQITVVYEKSN